MAAPTYYHYLDSGAPAIDGTVGSLLVALRKILVGVSGTAYGSKPSAGWTEPYTAVSNVSTFRNSTVTGSGMSLRVDDNGSGAGGAKEALIRCYKTMSDINTGTEPCPAASFTSGVVVRKSTAASSTARPWHAAADERTFYMEIDAAVTTFASGSSFEDCLWGAGDYITYNAGDNYNYFCAGRATVNAGINPSGLVVTASASTTSAITNTGFHIMSSIAGTPTSRLAGLVSFRYVATDVIGSAVSNAGTVDSITGGRSFEKGLICTQTSGLNIHGIMRGLIVPCQACATGVSGDVLTGIVGLSGTSSAKMFKAYGGSVSSRQGAMYIETVDAW